MLRVLERSVGFAPTYSRVAIACHFWFDHERAVGGREGIRTPERFTASRVQTGVLDYPDLFLAERRGFAPLSVLPLTAFPGRLLVYPDPLRFPFFPIVTASWDHA